MKFGLFDTEDRLWMGSDDGPELYDDENMARLAAQVVDLRLKQRSGRTRHKKFVGDPKVFRKKDDLPTHMSMEEALDKLEEGLVI